MSDSIQVRSLSYKGEKYMRVSDLIAYVGDCLAVYAEDLLGEPEERTRIMAQGAMMAMTDLNQNLNDARDFKKAKWYERV